MSSVFISYASSDRDVTRQVHSALSKEGFDSWWDRKLDDRGFHAALTEEAKTADVVLVILSRSSAESPWVRHEIDAGVGRLVAMRIDDVAREQWPPELRVINVIDVAIDRGSLGPSFADVIERCRDTVRRGTRKPRPSAMPPSQWTVFLGDVGNVIGMAGDVTIYGGNQPRDKDPK